MDVGGGGAGEFIFDFLEVAGDLSQEGDSSLALGGRRSNPSGGFRWARPNPSRQFPVCRLIST
jgi:hypothetical protein